VTAASVALRPKLLLVDDDPSIVSQLSLAFEDEYEVLRAQDPKTAWGTVQKEHPDLMTLDLALEGENPESGFSLLDKCLAFDPGMKIVLITGNDTRENARRAVERGAFDFFGKPIDLAELGVLLRRAAQLRGLEDRAAEGKVHADEDRLGDLLGRSREMKAVFRLLRRVAPTDVTVLILGESGTGKEVVAREIHRLSLRAEKPFISISCGAIPENLLESELFGHEKGAFTSAHTTRPGRLELAHGGTVFLDEIGDMPMTLQVKLLRFLQEREIERVGGRRVIPLDVRVVAATNRDLEQGVKEGRFREDLFYRINVVPIVLPPLRERKEDVQALAQFFMQRFSDEAKKNFAEISQEALETLIGYEWPGNVRELANVIERAIVLGQPPTIQIEDLSPGIVASEAEVNNRSTPQSYHESIDEYRREVIVNALAQAKGNRAAAARSLGLQRSYLLRLMKTFSIS